MPSQDVNLTEILVTPVESMIVKVAQGVASAQRSLDQAFYDGLVNPDKNDPLTKFGYQPSFYQMSEIEVELKVATHIEEKKSGEGARMFLAPFNAKYKNSYTFTADGSSTLKIKIVPVPPPIFNVPEEK
jgi:hypothetical protein